MMGVSTYPYGYETPPKRVTVADLDGKATWSKLHPEMRRRLLAMFDAAQEADHDLGLGGGWRTDAIQLATFMARHVEVPSGGCCVYQGKHYALKPHMAPAAPPGNSYHEPTNVDGQAFAADLIGDLTWMNANCWRFGLIHFARVNNEPWHVQPTELPRSRSKYAGQALAVWPLPTPPLPLTPPTLEDGMHLIVGRQANHADPRRWAWDGISIRKIADEAEFERLYLGPYAVFKLHPSFNTLAAPYWLSDEDIARYATPDKGLAA